MPNYKEQSSTPSSLVEWVRTFKVTVTNTFKQIPVISFFEERLQTLDDKVINKSLGRILKADLSDPETTFNLLNPETDEVIGTAKFINIYIILYSLYMYLAKKDDTKGNR